MREPLPSTPHRPSAAAFLSPPTQPPPPPPPSSTPPNPFAPLLATLHTALPHPPPPRLARYLIRFRRAASSFAASHGVEEWRRLTRVAAALEAGLVEEGEARRSSAVGGGGGVEERGGGAGRAEAFEEAAGKLRETFSQVEKVVLSSPRKKRKSDVGDDDISRYVANGEVNDIVDGVEEGEEEGRLRKSPTIYRDRHPAFVPPPSRPHTTASPLAASSLRAPDGEGPAAVNEAHAVTSEALKDAETLYTLLLDRRPPTFSSATSPPPSSNSTLSSSVASTSTSRQSIKDLALKIAEDLRGADAQRREALAELEKAAVGLDEGTGAGGREEVWALARRRLAELSQPLLTEHSTFRLSEVEVGDDAKEADTVPPRLLEDLVKLVDALAPLCASARDGLLSSVRAQLSSAPAFPPFTPRTATSAVRAAFDLVLAMRADLDVWKASIVAEMVEGTGRGALRGAAMERERKGVREVVEGRASATGVSVDEVVKRATTAWLAERSLAVALVDVVFSNVAIPAPSLASLDEDGVATSLPPTLWLHARKLFTLQNRIQVVVTLACLAVLVERRVAAEEEGGWMTRVAALLDAAASDEAAEDAPRLADIVEEVKRASGGREEVEKAVKRVLRYEDPVWTLLHSRLKAGLSDALRSDPTAAPLLPTFRAGRAAGPRGVGADAEPGRRGAEVGRVKGFEAPLLRRRIGEVATSLWEVKEWVEEAWPDALGHASG